MKKMLMITIMLHSINTYSMDNQLVLKDEDRVGKDDKKKDRKDKVEYVPYSIYKEFNKDFKKAKQNSSKSFFLIAPENQFKNNQDQKITIKILDKEIDEPSSNEIKKAFDDTKTTQEITIGLQNDQSTQAISRQRNITIDLTNLYKAMKEIYNQNDGKNFQDEISKLKEENKSLENFKKRIISCGIGAGIVGLGGAYYFRNDLASCAVSVLKKLPLIGLLFAKTTGAQ